MILSNIDIHLFHRPSAVVRESVSAHWISNYSVSSFFLYQAEQKIPAGLCGGLYPSDLIKVNIDFRAFYFRHSDYYSMWFASTHQEREEAKKSTSKDNEEIVLSGRDKKLVEQVTSYNVSVMARYFLFLHFL